MAAIELLAKPGSRLIDTTIDGPRTSALRPGYFFDAVPNSQGLNG